MFFDIGWPEMMLVGVIALVVIGPKDLPRALRIAGYWMRKARNMSREFQNSIDQMIREAELDDIRNDLKKATEFDLEDHVTKTIDPDGTLAESIKPPEIPDYFTEKPDLAENVEPVAAHVADAAALPDAAASPQTPDALPAPHEAAQQSGAHLSGNGFDPVEAVPEPVHQPPPEPVIAAPQPSQAKP